MKQSLLFLFALMVSLTGHSQDKDFDLSKYKFPDYKRHELEFNFNSNGNSQSNYVEIPSTNNTTGSKSDNSDSRFNSYLNIGYQFDHYTRKRIDWISSGLNGRYQYNKSENGNSYYKYSEPQIWGFFNARRRNYITEDKFFWEGSTDLRFDSYKRKTTYEYQQKETTTNKSFSFNVGIGIGTGRIELVNDLWQGYYILENLKNQNSIKQDLNDEDIFEFSRFISKLKNKRFFDSRLRRIAELQALDSMLHKQHLIINEDITYFTTLNDYWSFPISFERKTGKELGINVKSQFNHDYYKTIDYSNKPNSTYLESTFYFNHSKQINLYWERNFHFDLSNNTLLAKNEDVEKNSPKNLISTNALFGYGFYPDTRTRIQLNGKYFGNEYPYFRDEDMTKGWMNNVQLSLEVAYFISPQLQISGNLADSLWFSPLHSRHGHDLNYNLSLRYAIF